jgi:hypothetical protein
MIIRTMLTAAVLSAAAFATPATAANVDGPTATSALTASAGGVRYRALGTSAAQEEVYLGRSDLGNGANRTAQNVTWLSSNTFSFGYNQATDTLTSSINGGPVLSYANFIGGLAPSIAAEPFNVLQIQIRDDAVGAGAIALSNLNLNGVALTPDSLSGIEGALRYWQIAGDFRQSFTLTGTIDLTSGFSSSAEANRIEFTVGNAVPEPATWAMMIGGFGLIGTAMRRRRTPRLAIA